MTDSKADKTPFEIATEDEAFMSWLAHRKPRMYASSEVVDLYAAFCAGKRIGVLEGKS